jgi:pimeloyl-ACP methyl ester carboxylesterase
VFGNSGGATIALDLAARHPSAFPVVVAHEPPMPQLMPTETRLRKYEEILRVLDPAKVLPPGPELDVMTRMSANWEVMVTYEIGSFVGHDPDIDAIRAGGSRAVPPREPPRAPAARR